MNRTAYAVRDPDGRVRLETLRYDRDEFAIWIDYTFKCLPKGECRQSWWVAEQRRLGAEVVKVLVCVMDEEK